MRRRAPLTRRPSRLKIWSARAPVGSYSLKLSPLPEALNLPIGDMRLRKRNGCTPRATSHDASLVIDRLKRIAEIQFE